HANARVFPTYALPPHPYIIDCENPEDLIHRRWSPFSSFFNFHWQLNVMRRNAISIIRCLAGFDLAYIGAAALLLALLASVRILPLDANARRWKITWLLLTILLYCGGFLPIFFIIRYITWLALPLCLVLCLMILRDLRLPRIDPRIWSYSRNVLAALVVLSFFVAAYR